MLSVADYINQSPLVPVVFCCLLTVIILMQCFTKHRFLKIRLLVSFLLTFLAVLLLVFYNDIIKNESYKIAMTYGFLAIELGDFILLFSTVDFSLSNERLQCELNKSLDESKYYCLLDRKDRIKEISSRLLEDLGFSKKECNGKNLFDLIEEKYTIVGFNGTDSNKKEVKAYYDNYAKKAKDGEVRPVELKIESDEGEIMAIYFNESSIFQADRYKGRILLGEIKNEDSLMGLERDLESTSAELDLIKERFITILNKTGDGIYFNNLNERVIWFNDNLVRGLSLNGNTVTMEEFLNNLHPEDKALYEDIMTTNKSDDYSITYRYNTGAYYVYCKEEGHRIRIGKQIELCGIMKVINDYSFEHTDTILDTLGSEVDMALRLKKLQAEDTVYQVVYLKVDSIPEINEKYGRAIGNMMLGHYISVIKDKFLTENTMYRITGLEFVMLITNYNKMQTLKSYLNQDEKILHVSADYGGKEVELNAYMGISLSNDTAFPKDALANARTSLKVAQSSQYKSNYAYYRDIR